MKRIKARELGLMLLPVFVLIGVGLWIQRVPSWRNPLAAHIGPYRIVIDEAKLVPVTPRDVAMGWDTKVVVRAHYEGRLPTNVTNMDRVSSFSADLFARNSSGEQRLNTPSLMQPHIWSSPARDGTIAEVRLKLSQLPTNGSELIVRGSPRLEWFAPGSRWKKKLGQTAPTFAVVVRRAGQPTPVPQVSRVSPLKFHSVKIESVGVVGSGAADTRATVFVLHLQPLSEEEFHHAYFEDVHLIDARGKRHMIYEQGGLQFGRPTLTRNDYDAGMLHQNFTMALKSIPRNLDPIHLRASVSVNDCWPLKISVPVRAKK